MKQEAAKSSEKYEEYEKYETVRILTLREMIFRGKGTLMRRLIHALISIALRLFFRRIEVVGAENVPTTGALIFVLNHPNGLVDPGLVFVSLARRVSFLAKSTLFDIPVGGWLLRTFEILPVYRRVDAAGDMTKNRQTFGNCYELLDRGRCIAIFPEGISHNETKLQPIKTGAARIALGALGVGRENQLRTTNDELRTGDEREGAGESIGESLREKGLRIMPVGLFYTSKTAFRSEALIRYGEIFPVAPAALDENGEPPRAAVLDLTAEIETALRNVTLNLESERELDAVLKAEALFSSVYENLLFRDTLTESFLRLRNLAEKYQLLERNDPQKMRELSEKIRQYEDRLKTSGVTAESLSVLQHPTAYVFRYLILRALVLLVLSPLSIVGAIVHSPGYVFSNFIGLIFKTHGADAAGSTYKILAACVLMPLTWLVTAGIVFYHWDWQFALASIPLTILCGYVALRSSETLIDLSVWLKSAWLLFRQRALFLRLLGHPPTLQQQFGPIIHDKQQNI